MREARRLRALALEHLRPDPIGIFGDVLEERGIEVDRVMLDQGDEVPDSRRYDLVVAMGAALSVWEEDEFPWLVAEKRAIREAVLSGVPYFGVCFGAQLLADVLGGRSYGGPEPELGASQVFLTAAARRDPVFRGFPPDLEVLEWHTNHFDLPPGGIRLARSPRYENQAIRFGRVAYGIQCHLEPSLEDIRAWFEGFPTLSEVFEARHGAGSVEAFLGEYATFVPLLQATGRQLFGRWLENALALGGLGLAAQAVNKARAPVLEPPTGSFGRDAERGRIDIALRAAREGKSTVIVLRGEAGIGKTALLDDAVQRSTGLRMLRIRGEDSEPELPFAGLAALCRPLAGYLEAIEPARAERLAGVLGLEGPARAEDRFSVSAGTLDLLAAAAEETPLLVVVDDAHWLGDATSEAIAFVAQRLDNDGIALLVATEAEDDFPGLEELRLAGLDLPASLALLEASYGEQLAPDVADLVVEAASGNPLGLLEIPLGLTTAERAGEQPIREALPASAEWAFLRRLAALPADARRALLIASLTADGDLDQIGRSCAELGVDVSALEAAEEAGMVHTEAGALAFRHALARTAVSYSALRADRRAAHAALARSTDGEVRLWHLARAAAGADEEVASGLERAARRADHQGAHATAARALELAARLTPDGDSGAKRLLAAARSAHLAGHVHAALDHLDAALRRAREHSLRIDIEHLRGRIAARSGSAERARDVLVATADLCERDDPEKAAEMLADAVLPALRAGAPAQACEIARRAMDLVRGRGGRAELVATVMLGTALVLTGEHREGTALVDRAADLADADGGLADAQLSAYVATGLARAGRNERARESLERI
ncbi:MAG: hypothetical protein QOE60_1860, partial [Thermoleophilaceae bacterium]|nr:hypothetical protein [Thermoleophilaceae bacterium]